MLCKSLKSVKFDMDTLCSTVFKSNEEELAIWVFHQPPPDACFFVILLLLQPNTTEHLILNPGSVHTVTVDNLPHLVPTTFGLYVKKQKKTSFLKGLTAKLLRRSKMDASF